METDAVVLAKQTFGILVVDDERTLRFALKEGLSEEGYRVETAGDISEALSRLEQDELTVACHQVFPHLRIAVARLEPFAHQNAQIAGERCVGIVDRLILANHAAKSLRERAGARLQYGVGEDLVGFDGESGRGEQKCREQKRGYAPEPTATAIA